MKACTFQVEMEPDGKGWHIFFADWEEIGASTWGSTQEEALDHIREVLEMIIEEFAEEGTPLPPIETEERADAIPVSLTV